MSSDKAMSAAASDELANCIDWKLLATASDLIFMELCYGVVNSISLDSALAHMLSAEAKRRGVSYSAYKSMRDAIKALGERGELTHQVGVAEEMDVDESVPMAMKDLFFCYRLGGGVYFFLTADERGEDFLRVGGAE